MFSWGISNLKSIMEASQKLRKKQFEARELLKNKATATIEKAKHGIQKVKTLHKQPTKAEKKAADEAS